MVRLPGSLLHTTFSLRPVSPRSVALGFSTVTGRAASVTCSVLLLLVLLPGATFAIEPPAVLSSGTFASGPAQEGKAEEQEEGNPSSGKDKKGQDEDERARAAGREWYRELSDPDEPARNEDLILELFFDVVADASASTLKIMDGRRQLALATVVSEDGLAVTKASELTADFVCRLHDGTEVAAEVVGIDRANDVALLRIMADNLVPVQWETETVPVVGSWIASVGQNPFPLTIGVVSVSARPIEPPRGIIGVLLTDGEPSGAMLTKIVDDSPGDQAGLKVGDVITEIDGTEIDNFFELQQIVSAKRAGDIVRVKLLRDDEVLEKLIELGNRQEVDERNARSLQQNRLGGELSRIRAGFTKVIQHDAGIGHRECGGPVVGLTGKPFGINIARAGRVDSFVLPASVLLPIIEELKTGEFSPVVVNEPRIAKIDVQIRRLQRQLDEQLRPELAKLQAQATDLAEQQSKLETQIEAGELGEDAAHERLTNIIEQREKLGDEERRLNFRLKNLEQTLSKLEARKTQLQRGVGG